MIQTGEERYEKGYRWGGARYVQGKTRGRRFGDLKEWWDHSV